MKKILLLLSMITYLLSAPFNLHWGEKFDKDRFDCIEIKKEYNVITCFTKSVPKGLSIGQLYMLSFDKDLGLQKISMASKDITNDLYGIEGRKQYNRLKNILNKKYGNLQSIEFIGKKVWTKDDEFYRCLEYSGCGAYMSIKKLDSGEIIFLQLKGSGRDSGYLLLMYEGPKWNEVNRKQEELKNKLYEELL